VDSAIEAKGKVGLAAAGALRALGISDQAIHRESCRDRKSQDERETGGEGGFEQVQAVDGCLALVVESAG
jgi:hypothetical protein